MIASLVIDSPVGPIEIVYQNDQITRINLDSRKPFSLQLNSFEEQILEQVNGYFSNADYSFSLPIEFKGTKHQRAVWSEMLKIPPGTVKTYGEIAKLIGSSGQAVGNACRRNPLPLIVPCHRIVAANALGGFAGATSGVLVGIKQSLLAHEGASY